jgi:NAD(P)H-hydrate epimerase
LAVDIPSGVDSDNGRADGSVVEADETVTFGAVKAGCVLYPGAAYTGKITVSPIGFPEKLIANAGHIETPAAEEMAALLPPRNPEAHKHAVGRVLVIAGSRGMTGAAALCAQAALRTGAGIVTLACPASLNDIFEIKLTEVMTHPLSETGEGALAKAAADEIIKMAADYDVVIVGPGLGNDPETEYVVKKIVEAGPAALLLDADGINALTGQPDILSACQGDVIITPHPGELARLTGLSAKEIEADRLAAAGETAAKLGVVTVLKGAASVIAAPDRRVSVNSTGNSGLATAGTGDVLSGLIGGLWSQHMRAAEAAILATYIHGLAGDMAAFDLTEYALLAGDLIEYTPEAFGATEEAMNRPIIRSEEM